MKNKETKKQRTYLTNQYHKERKKKLPKKRKKEKGKAERNEGKQHIHQIKKTKKERNK